MCKMIAKRRSRRQARGAHGSIVKEGMWVAAPFLLNTIDILYPTITKTLATFFSCRNLQDAGWWLEQDYGVQCGYASPDNDAYTVRYAAHRTWVAVAALVYSLGVTAFFMYLVYAFKHHGTAGGDKVVHRALGPVAILQRTFLD